MKRYIPPRSAQESEEKRKERERNIQPFTLQNPSILFKEGEKGEYTGNTPFVKQIHKKMKSYVGKSQA